MESSLTRFEAPNLGLILQSPLSCDPNIQSMTNAIIFLAHTWTICPLLTTGLHVEWTGRRHHLLPETGYPCGSFRDPAQFSFPFQKGSDSPRSGCLSPHLGQDQ